MRRLNRLPLLICFALSLSGCGRSGPEADQYEDRYPEFWTMEDGAFTIGRSWEWNCSESLGFGASLRGFQVTVHQLREGEIFFKTITREAQLDGKIRSRTRRFSANLERIREYYRGFEAPPVETLQLTQYEVDEQSSEWIPDGKSYAAVAGYALEDLFLLRAWAKNSEIVEEVKTEADEKFGPLTLTRTVHRDPELTKLLRPSWYIANEGELRGVAYEVHDRLYSGRPCRLAGYTRP